MKAHTAKILFFFFTLLISVNSFSQERLNVLLDSLSTAQNDSVFMVTAVKIASELKYKDWNRTQLYLERAREKAENSSPAVVAEFYRLAADVYYDRDAFDIAIDYYLVAYDYYKNKPGDKQFQIENSLAVIHARVNNKKQALYYFKRTYDFHKKKGNQTGIARALNNIGTLYLNYNNPDSALFFLNKSLRLLNKKSDDVLRNYVLTNVARSYDLLGKKDSSSFYFGKIINFLPTIKDQATREYIIDALAKHYLKNNQPEKALHYAEMLQRENTVPYSFSNLQALQILYQSHLELGNYKESAEYFKEYDAIRDSLNMEEKAVNVEKQKIEYDFKVKEEINQLNNRQKRLSMTIAILGLVVILLALGIILIRYKNKLVKAKLRNELNESRENELKLQIELKDKELATKTIAETRREEVYNSVREDLKKLKSSTDKGETKQALNSVLNKLEQGANKSIWEEFELRFANVHESFYDNLLKKHPELSTYDKRVCALIKLNLSSKEIADITGVTVKSVENTRTRLRKKLNITNQKIDLNQYLSEIG